MAPHASISALEPEFDGFLYAPIGEDRNGEPLSVLSALARENVDPWEEAAMLARLPDKAAIAKLAAVIAALPSGPGSGADPKATAARLIALLPRRGAIKVTPQTGLPAAMSARRRPYAAYVLMFVVVIVALQLILVFKNSGRSTGRNAPFNGMPPNSAAH